jgi:Tol biopolymer transport system component
MIIARPPRRRGGTGKMRSVLGVTAVISIAAPFASSAGQASQAQVFAPGVISGPENDFAPAFASDSSYVLFSRKTDKGISIMISLRQGKTWSRPSVVPFSGRWTDLESALSPDGTYLVFASNRPAADGGEALSANYGGGAQSGGNLWRVDISHGHWSAPSRLPGAVNDQNSVWTPSIARDGALYFMSTDPATGRFRLHVAPSDRGRYAPAQDLAFSSGAFNDVDPAVNPRQEFLVFSSDRASPGTGARAGPERLFIAFGIRGDAPLVCQISIPGWEDASLSQVEARFSPDGRTLYFASRRLAHKTGEPPRGDWDDGKANIWMIPFDAGLWSQAPGASAACRAHRQTR